MHRLFTTVLSAMCFSVAFLPNAAAAQSLGQPPPQQATTYRDPDNRFAEIRKCPINISLQEIYEGDGTKVNAEIRARTAVFDVGSAMNYDEFENAVVQLDRLCGIRGLIKGPLTAEEEQAGFAEILRHEVGDGYQMIARFQMPGHQAYFLYTLKTNVIAQFREPETAPLAVSLVKAKQP